MITIVFVEESQEEKKRIRGRGRVDREMEWARTRNSSRSPDGVWPVFGLDAVTWQIRRSHIPSASNESRQVAPSAASSRLEAVGSAHGGRICIVSRAHRPFDLTHVKITRSVCHFFVHLRVLFT